MDASKLLAGAKIVPVVVIDDVDKAVALAECLVAAGLRIIEVTLRTAAGLEAIERIVDTVPTMIVGAGSIRSVDQVDAVMQAGARFGVAPGATGRLLNTVDRAGLPFVPGAATASEMMRLLQRGYTLQKFFPAELAGGIPFLKAVAAPVPEIRFMPTGGISAELAPDYLALNNVAAVGGSWITPQGLIETGDFEAIARLAADAAQLGM
ncbi:MAG: bifunctional 4-hydroxy-2-oxoglutarate aldolase/2-dehydro-3-deoxy-phosphogluconate aldolase [Gammaproteobacteria bacterium]|nr:bifunctional 4-hydroxy-2-oxoglutarate aldolase/2-dehydro-3-deoxy-phosphogluconate aldolase [Gammaproteobacteria bacterium]MDH3751224.1 bifunctional 4-hydroxy-2-oxoglutarate aldolase/2-dehydro-3-deoxy-phosphogluconate aldolase [Gammaproteobacteria bacterium]